MQKDEEIKIVNIQLIALIIALISSIISIIITYNQKKDLENKKTNFSSEELFNITLFNRILIIVLSFVFLYVNYKLYKISKDQGEDLKSYILQIIASIITIIPGFIALYVVLLSSTEQIVDVENPII
ncbi:MAG: hypothetical protein Q4E75_06530 [bacterium]|nr:hypothetical protein [bacterium]